MSIGINGNAWRLRKQQEGGRGKSAQLDIAWGTGKDAFFELTENLKGKRPTIVLMVGDHGPTIARTLMRSESRYDQDLVESLVPYVIWSNYKEVPDQYGNLASMEDLVPMMLDVAGLPLSTYYSFILELRKSVPLRNGKGAYVDANGKEGRCFTYGRRKPIMTIIGSP